MILLGSNSKASKLKAQILLDYSDETVARAVARAISPDNPRTLKGLLVNSMCKDGVVTTTIEVESKIPTLIATVDDLLFCVSVAEKTVDMMRIYK
jgi:hypothetical protein